MILLKIKMSQIAPSIILPKIQNIEKLTNPKLPNKNIGLLIVDIDFFMPTVNYLNNIRNLVSELKIDELVLSHQLECKDEVVIEILTKFCKSIDFVNVKFISNGLELISNFSPKIKNEIEKTFQNLEKVNRINGPDITKAIVSFCNPYYPWLEKFLTNVNNFYLIKGIDHRSSDYKLRSQGMYKYIKTKNKQMVVDRVDHNIFGFDFYGNSYSYIPSYHKCIKGVYFNSDFSLGDLFKSISIVKGPESLKKLATLFPFIKYNKTLLFQIKTRITSLSQILEI
jgi:hypothetical protein